MEAIWWVLAVHGENGLLGNWVLNLGQKRERVMDDEDKNNELVCVKIYEDVVGWLKLSWRNNGGVDSKDKMIQIKISSRLLCTDLCRKGALWNDERFLSVVRLSVCLSRAST